ncbi:hypothetical protein IHE45_14G030200 [Dioscorea alata]|uniref:Uncharacterized protein n=1 Tax=Dioscorea alata TaxID=55571 RepID=A0ACB7UQU8_DIOAL|nr:hypothetical protein IHE45_14G030200 [Dioscorea alata]
MPTTSQSSLSFSLSQMKLKGLLHLQPMLLCSFIFILMFLVILHFDVTHARSIKDKDFKPSSSTTNTSNEEEEEVVHHHHHHHHYSSPSMSFSPSSSFNGDDPVHPLYGVSKRLVPQGPNPLHN